MPSSAVDNAYWRSIQEEVCRPKGRARCSGEPADGTDQVSRAYMQLQLRLQRQYLDQLRTIERLCIQLSILQRGNHQLDKLREMHLKHIRPLIARLQAPTSKVVKSEVQWLLKMTKLLPPFLEEFGDSLRDIRQRAQRDMEQLVNERVTAAAA